MSVSKNREGPACINKRKGESLYVNRAPLSKGGHKGQAVETVCDTLESEDIQIRQSRSQ